MSEKNKFVLHIPYFNLKIKFSSLREAAEYAIEYFKDEIKKNGDYMTPDLEPSILPNTHEIKPDTKYEMFAWGDFFYIKSVEKENKITEKIVQIEDFLESLRFECNVNKITTILTKKQRKIFRDIADHSSWLASGC